MKKKLLASFVLLLALVYLANYSRINDYFTEYEPWPESYRSTEVYGERLHLLGRPAHWNIKTIDLGDTGFIAHVGPSIYEDEDNDEIDYYSIDIEKQRSKDSWHVFFSMDFEPSDLPKDFDKKPVSEVVFYDPATRIVEFKIGDGSYTYALPLP